MPVSKSRTFLNLSRYFLTHMTLWLLMNLKLLRFQQFLIVHWPLSSGTKVMKLIWSLQWRPLPWACRIVTPRSIIYHRHHRQPISIYYFQSINLKSQRAVLWPHNNIRRVSFHTPVIRLSSIPSHRDIPLNEKSVCLAKGARDSVVLSDCMSPEDLFRFIKQRNSFHNSSTVKCKAVDKTNISL